MVFLLLGDGVVSMHDLLDKYDPERQGLRKPDEIAFPGDPGVLAFNFILNKSASKVF